MPDLTERQATILRLVCIHRERHGFAPSMRELRDQLKLGSVSSVFSAIRMLRLSGYLTDENGHRTLRLTSKGIAHVLR